MPWTLLVIRHLPSAPEQGVIIARVLAFGQYETGEQAHHAAALDEVPAVEHGLVVFVRGGLLVLRPEHQGKEGQPVGSLRPPLVDWRASRCRPLFPELGPPADPLPAWTAPALDHLGDLFLQPPPSIAAFEGTKTTALIAPRDLPDPPTS